MKTLQEIFDLALNGMRKQAGPSGEIGSDGVKSCEYRSFIGGASRACVVGQLFPDNVYDPAFDTQGSVSMILDSDCRGLFGKALRANDIDLRVSEVEDLLIRMQDAHDESIVQGESDAMFMARFEVAMGKVADYLGLSYTPPALPPVSGDGGQWGGLERPGYSE